MVNIIFCALIIIGITYGVLTGRGNIILDALLASPKDAFTLFIDIYIQLIFWGGILKIVEDSGLLERLSKYICKIIHPLFNRLPKDSMALKYIAINFVANILSMGSAATPFGLKAMDELNKLNNYSDTASDEMITFLLINTSGLCIIPTTLLALRGQYGSNNVGVIILPIFIISLTSTALSIFIDIGMRRLCQKSAIF